MAVRSSTAQWNGTLREGSGTMKIGTGAYEGPFSFVSRFEEGPGTNPEELIAAAHAGCFSMAFSADLGRAGYTPTRVSTTADVHLDRLEGGWTITKVVLHTEAEVPGISAEEFARVAEGAKQGCPVSRLLAPGAEIELEATLVG